MRVLLLEKNRLLKTKLPNKVEGNYWIVNENKKNLVNIEAKDNHWVLKSNDNIKISLNNEEEDFIFYDELIIELNTIYYLIDTKLETTYKLFCENIYDNNIKQYSFSSDNTTEIYIGNDQKSSLQTSVENDIKCNISSFAKNQLKITINNDNVYIDNLNPRINMYINNFMHTSKILRNGDIVFIDGVKLGFFGEYLLINCSEFVSLDPLKFFLRDIPLMPEYNLKTKDNEEYIEVFKKEDFLVRPPRINKIIEEKNIKIDPVPSSQNTDQVPMIFMMGTMLTMGTTSLMTGMSAISKITAGESTIKDQLVSLITCGVMLFGMIMLPLIRNVYMKHRKKKKEKIRQKRYKEYLSEKKKEIINEMNYQKQILLENNLSPEACKEAINSKSKDIWERKIEHSDFLCVRLGLGTIMPKITISAPEEHFTIEKDELEQEMYTTIKELKVMDNVPIVVDLKQKLCSAIIGKTSFTTKFLDNILLGLLTNHGYDNLRIVILTNDKNKHKWEKYQNLPFFWNNEKTLRFFGTNIDDYLQISSHLTEIYNNRIEMLDHQEEQEGFILQLSKPYYLIITDAIENIDNVGIIQTILSHKINVGFSILINSKNMDYLPSECNLFINIDEKVCNVFEQDQITNEQTIFRPDTYPEDISDLLLKLSNIPVDITDGKFVLPPKYSFLEMYNVGNINQLNAVNRWKDNNVITSLQAPVGINEQGELFKLDIHEKYHGPHGLVAGMTGSGKSEWLITYILSMAINYHPDEVQFVLIDYKGGGLAGVFENRETGFKLPHLAGTITNLDVVEINRALASVQSELKRRQTMFNTAREALNESTIDIYKYQRFYREGKVKEPMSHLIIISDEFAELKAQQPDFMQELISTARIGRSLGVHLILATQKPSGVVDDQIWSNSKFRVCLKVQDKSDSNEMIKRPDAAMIKEPGRFFLQVGYNELFAKGQSAYAGSPYYESNTRKNEVDTSIRFVNEIGEVYKTVENNANTPKDHFKGEELPNILKYIKETADNTTTHVRKLWLDRIPDIIYHDDLKKKYNYQKRNFVLEPIIGEYDAPEIQQQGLLTLPLTKEGNALIYGITGSGKENMLFTLLYSLITTYTVKELNVYIIDCGSETLLAFKDAPQIGSVIKSDENEKINNLFKKLLNDLEQRKELFQDYNGDIYTYCQKSGKTVSSIVLIINNMDNFQELYSEYQETLIALTREGAKYGIITILTANSTGTVRLKLSQNFTNVLALQLKDKYDYSSVLGNTQGKIPSKVKGRGLVKLTKIYEFQTAYIVEEANQIDYVKNVCQKLKSVILEQAPKIAILPEKVNLEFIKDSITTVSQVPIGVLKDSLEIAKFDFLNKEATLVVTQDDDLIEPFITSLLNVFNEINNLNTFIIDAKEIFENVPNKVKMFNNNFENIIEELEKFINSINAENNSQDRIFIFSGLTSCLSKINQDIQNKLFEVLKKIKEMPRMNFIIADNSSEIKKLEYDSWYKETVNNSRGIYLGNGIDNQYSIKITKSTRSLREEIPGDFGYVIVKGKPFLIKLIQIKEGEKDE